MAALITTGVITVVGSVLCAIGYKEDLRKIEESKTANA